MFDDNLIPKREVETPAFLWRVVLSPEHSSAFQTWKEAEDYYVHKTLAGAKVSVEVLTSEGWINILDKSICQYCHKPYGEEPNHAECEARYDEEFRSFVDYRAVMEQEVLND